RKSKQNQACFGVAFRRERGEGRADSSGIARLRLRDHRGCCTVHRQPIVLYAPGRLLTLGMQRWRIGMRLRNVRTPGEGGAGGRQKSVRESLYYYSVDNRPPVRTLGERAVHRRLTRAASLIVITLSSIGLWVAICGALTALTSAVLR